MNICIVNPGFSMGGAEKVTIELANNLGSKHEVSLIDFSGENYYFYHLNSNINTKLKIPCMSTKRKLIKKILNFKYRLTKRVNNPFSLFKEQIESLCDIFKSQKFDCIIFSQGTLTSFIPYFKLHLPDIKIIAWQHNNFDVYLNNYHQNIKKYYIEGIKQADSVVCLTESDVKKFQEVNPKSYCIYNALTIKEPIISEVTNKNIIFAGRLVINQKGLDFLIEIAKKLDEEWKIIIAGDGDDRKRFQNMISKSSVEEKIVLLGNKTSEELREVYAKGSIFISTSRWEGFGLVITEAMASGLPVISFNNDGPAEILMNGKYGILVDKFELDDFTYKLTELVSDVKKRKYWKKKSLERVESFRAEKILDLWEDQINLVLRT